MGLTPSGVCLQVDPDLAAQIEGILDRVSRAREGVPGERGAPLAAGSIYRRGGEIHL